MSVKVISRSLSLSLPSFFLNLRFFSSFEMIGRRSILDSILSNESTIYLIKESDVCTRCDIITGVNQIRGAETRNKSPDNYRFESRQRRYEIAFIDSA